MIVKWIEDRQGFWAFCGVIVAAVGLVVTIFQFRGDELSEHSISESNKDGFNQQKIISINQGMISTTQQGPPPKEINSSRNTVPDIEVGNHITSNKKIMHWGEQWENSVWDR